MYNVECDQTLKLNTITYCHDAAAVYLFSQFGTATVISVLDPTSFKIVSQFELINAQINYSVKPAVDNDAIYIPTLHGDILCIDKFSGERISEIDLGVMCIVSNLQILNNRLFAVCGLPISDGIKTNTNLFCLVSGSKEYNKKTCQSQIMQGPFHACLVDDFIWIAAGKTLYKYSQECELLGTQILQFNHYMQLLSNKTFICAFSDKGSIESFNKESLVAQARMIMPSAISCPIVTAYSMLCPADTMICEVSMGNSNINSYIINQKVISTLAVNNKVYILDVAGKLFALDNPTKIIGEFNLSVGELASCDDNVFIISREQVWKI